MNFKNNRESDEPDINLIPMIDVLLVVLIFLMVSTTYAHKSALKVDLPQSFHTEQGDNAIKPIVIKISANGQYALNENPGVLDGASLKTELRASARDHDTADTVVRIEADGAASHQTVVFAMDTAASLGLTHISIVTARNP